MVNINLFYAGADITVPALVDSGADFSVFPYEVGLELGFVWEEQTLSVPLGGMLKGVPAVGVLVRGEIPGLPEKALVFAWAKTSCRVILGQLNFFQQYRVTFEGYENAFDISAKIP
jgi:hypothetical protein